MSGLLVKYSLPVGDCKNEGEDRSLFHIEGKLDTKNANLQCLGLPIDNSHTVC